MNQEEFIAAMAKWEIIKATAYLGAIAVIILITYFVIERNKKNGGQ